MNYLLLLFCLDSFIIIIAIWSIIRVLKNINAFDVKSELRITRKYLAKLIDLIKVS